MQVELTEEAINCLKFWQEHPFYGGSMSDVIIRNMEEWLCRDMAHSSYKDIETELERIKKG